MAGARLGFAIANEGLIRDMNTIKYSTNPYNVNRLTSEAGIAAIKDNCYYMNNCKTIMKNREYTEKELTRLGFDVLPSSANFVFAKSNEISGETLYLALKERGILVRHFKKDLINDYNRITIGKFSDMEELIRTIERFIK
jgi:histidinol-phosphate aminotransferase